MKKFVAVSIIASQLLNLSSVNLNEANGQKEENQIVDSTFKDIQNKSFEMESSTQTSETNQKEVEVNHSEEVIESEEGDFISEDEVTDVENQIIVQGENWKLFEDGILEINGGEIPSTPGWSKHRSKIEKIIFTKPTLLKRDNTGRSNAFYSLYYLKTIENLNLCDTSELTSMIEMFMGCGSIEELDLSNFDTSNVTRMSEMFRACYQLKKIDLSSFDTSNVLTMEQMFQNCSQLTNLDLSSFNTSKVTNITQMFQGTAIKELDLSNFNTESLSNAVLTFPNSVNKITLGENFVYKKAMGLPFGNGWYDKNNVYLKSEESFIAYHNTNKITNTYQTTALLELEFETFGGTSVATQYANTGEKWEVPSPPKKDRYVFEGWYADPTFTRKFNFNKQVTISEKAYAKWEEIVIETNELEVPVGTPESLVDPNRFVSTVKIGDKVLSTNKYTVELLDEPDTMTVRKKAVPISVAIRIDDVEENIQIEGLMNVVWGSTIASRGASLVTYPLDMSVSLLYDKENPYLVANNGDGLSTYATIRSVPNIAVFGENVEEIILDLRNPSKAIQASVLKTRFNEEFEKTVFQYGNVLEYSVENKIGVNENGENSWISRDNQLTREAIGYSHVYYEFTRDEGYRLLVGNRLKVNHGIKVPFGITIEEMNQRIDDFIEFPSSITNPEDFTIAFREIEDTNLSGSTKKAVIAVSERLATGGFFTFYHDVTFTVNPRVSEYYFDIDGKEIKNSEITDFELGASFTPNPENYMTIEGTLYKYVGWKSTMQGGINIGKPPITTYEATYFYVYEQANRLIHVTLPTTMVFGTFDQTEDIQSNSYELVNHSNKIGTEIILEGFEENDSEIKFLEEQDANPSTEQVAARLNLLVNNEIQINSLNRKTNNQVISKLIPEESVTIGFSGKYFGNYDKEYRANYTMMLLFKPVEGD